MHTRRTPKAVVGIAAAVVALVLMAVPASANPYDAEITSGFLDVYELFEAPPDAPFATFDLSDSGGNVMCSTSTSTSGSTVFGQGSGTPATGTFSSSITRVYLTQMPPGSGDYFLVVKATSFNGTWTAPDLVSATLSEALEVYDVADTWPTNEPPCDIPNGEPCAVTADNITVYGTYTGTAPHAVTSITINGVNSDFETTVTGPAGNCGALVAIDNGHVELRNVVITLT